MKMDTTKLMKKIFLKPKFTIFSILAGAVLFFVSPYDFKLTMAIVLSVEALVLWGASAMNNAAVSLFFIIGTMIFSLAPAKTVFHFPMTENFYMIILSYIITKGVTETGAAEVFSKNIMEKIVKSPVKLILFSYIAGFLLMFFIPQPFPRVILLMVFYVEFFKNQKMADRGKEVLFFSIFTASTFTSMFFLTGDMLLNYVVVAISKADINWLQWFVYMSVPTVITCITTFVLFLLVFKKDIFSVRFQNLDNADGQKNKKLSKEQKKMVFVCGVIFLGFATQSINNLNGTAIMLTGVLLGAVLGIIKINFLKSINWKLLMFFTGAFSVGGVLNDSGAADIIVNNLMKIVPAGNFQTKLIFLIIVTLILNFFLGSAVTTSSVVIPTIAQLGIFAPHSAVLTLFVYTVVSIQYILPFHHATVMVGFGEGLYGNNIIIKYGIFLTVLTFFIVLYVCMPWWHFVGII